jgi:hypothetical protein
MRKWNYKLTHTTDGKNIIIHLITKPLRSIGMTALFITYISLNVFRFNIVKHITNNLLCYAYKHLSTEQFTKAALTFSRKTHILYLHEEPEIYNTATKLTHVFQITQKLK